MKTRIHQFILCATSALTIVCAGCNIFSPANGDNIDSKDAEALTYEGYLRFRENDYAEASRYFKQAIQADSSHSEAWYGLAKAKLNDQDINTFELLMYLNVESEKTIPLSDMDDSTAQKYRNGIDSVMVILKEFIYRDTTNRLDGEITYKTIADSYMLLQLAETMFTLRDQSKKLDFCLDGQTDDGSCNVSNVLNAIDNDLENTLNDFHDMFGTCNENPEAMATIADKYLPAFKFLPEEDQNSATQSMCGALNVTTQNTDDQQQNEKTLSILIAQLGYSTVMDDDGDGCIDEEIYDGEDNDGDGEIDEDVRDYTANIIYDIELANQNHAEGKNGIRDLRIVKSAAPDEKYSRIDLNFNGLKGASDPEEWTFIYPDYADRIRAKDHRFQFTQNLVFNPQQHTAKEFQKLKQAVLNDNDINNIQYDLEYRKNVIGGCWVNYSDRDFTLWFEGRK